METIVFDVRTNCRMFLWRYMVAVIVLLFLIGAVIGTEEHNGSNYWHTLIEVFEGIPIYRKNEQQIFRLPVFIMIFQLYLNFLIGNNLMMLHNVYISGEGVHLKDGILAGLVLISIIIMACAHRIRKFDFIQNGRNIN